MKNSLLNRLSAFMLAALLCLSLTGCAGKNVSEDSSSAGDNTMKSPPILAKMMFGSPYL